MLEEELQRKVKRLRSIKEKKKREQFLLTFGTPHSMRLQN
jgi:outer membrane protein assembly factor BamE (lipoprotein component of BamABCDE complex)